MFWEKMAEKKKPKKWPDRWISVSLFLPRPDPRPDQTLDPRPQTRPDLGAGLPGCSKETWAWYEQGFTREPSGPAIPTHKGPRLLSGAATHIRSIPCLAMGAPGDPFPRLPPVHEIPGLSF